MRTRSDNVELLQLPSGQVEVDEAGYLFDPTGWSPDFARLVAEQDSVDLKEMHWRVFSFMQDYLEDHGIAADARFAIRFIAEELGLSKFDAKQKLFELFPQGYVKQACKMSGMRQPRAWSTG